MKRIAGPRRIVYHGYIPGQDKFTTSRFKWEGYYSVPYYCFVEHYDLSHVVQRINTH